MRVVQMGKGNIVMKNLNLKVNGKILCRMVMARKSFRTQVSIVETIKKGRRVEKEHILLGMVQFIKVLLMIIK